MTAPTVALGEVVDVLSGFAFKSKQFGDDGDLPVARIRDVTRGYSKTYYTGDYDERFVVRDGDVLVGMDGEFNRARWRGGRALLNQRVCKVTPKNGRLDGNYLYHFLPAALKAIERETPFVTVKHLSAAKLKAIQLPLPPIEEQRRIAAVLDAADEVRAKRREALAKLDTLAEAIFIDMFGDPVANARGIPTARLDEVFDIARGGSPRPIQDFLTYDPNGVNWVMIGDAPEGAKYITGTSKRIRPEGEKRSRRVHPGDLLLTNSMSFGRPYIMRTTGCIHDGWLVLAPKSNSTSPDYFHAALGMRSVYDEFVRRAPGATVKNLNIDLVRSLELPVPSAQDQTRFANIVERSEACVPRARESMALLDDLFASLQQRAFRGEL